MYKRYGLNDSEGVKYLGVNTDLSFVVMLTTYSKEGHVQVSIEQEEVVDLIDQLCDWLYDPSHRKRK